MGAQPQASGQLSFQRTLAHSRTTLQAIPIPRFALCVPLPTDPASNLRLPMSFLIGLHVRKHYPWYWRAAIFMT